MAFRNRAAEKARRAASGGDGPPAGQDPQVPGEPVTPAVADRGAMRKRARRTRRTRDVLLHELGALVMEMYRQGRHDPGLVERKAREAITVDSELRALSGALGRDESLASLRAAGIAGPCQSCGTLLAREDRFCNRCGAAASVGAAAAPPSGAPVAGLPPSGSPLDGPPPSGSPVEGPSGPGSPAGAPPPSGSPVDGPPPTGSPVDGPPPASGDDGVPTYRVTSR